VVKQLIDFLPPHIRDSGAWVDYIAARMISKLMQNTDLRLPAASVE
jgi:hypothetical protein